MFLHLFSYSGLLIVIQDGYGTCYFFSFMQISLQIKLVIFKAVFENESTLMYTGNGLRKKTSRFFIQMFSASLPSLFHLNFLLVHDIPYGSISSYSICI